MSPTLTNHPTPAAGRRLTWGVAIGGAGTIVGAVAGPILGGVTAGAVALWLAMRHHAPR